MTTQEKLLTADQLWQMGPGKRAELVQGVLVEMAPTGDVHGELALWLGHLILQHIVANDLGTATGAETGFVLSTDPDTVRAPDVGFISKARLAPMTGRFYRLAPDLAVEVVSPSDTGAEIMHKADDYLRAGTRLVWVIYPDLRVVAVYRPDQPSVVLRGDERLEGGDTLPGFSITVNDVFSRMRS